MTLRIKTVHILMAEMHRRRMKTEEKAKVVATVWGMEFIQLLVALDIVHQDNFEEKN